MYIDGYTVRNLVLGRHVSAAVKHNLKTFIRRCNSSKDKFEFGYPHATEHGNRLEILDLERKCMIAISM